MLEAVNRFFDGSRGLASVTEHTGGSKHPQCEIFGGGMNYCDPNRFLAYLRAFPWTDYGVYWAQVAMKGEHDQGFGFVEVYRKAYPYDEGSWVPEPVGVTDHGEDEEDDAPLP